MTPKEKLELLRSYRTAGGTGSYASLLKEVRKFDGGGEKKRTFLQPNDPKLPPGKVHPLHYQISTERASSIGGEGGEPAYLIPTFKYGKTLEDPVTEFNNTGEHLGGPFKTWQEAEKFGELRHKYVEKGEAIPSPIRTWGKEYADGGPTDPPKELSGPTIRGKKYPKGTIVTNDPELYQRNQDSLKLYNQAEQGQQMFESYFDSIKYGKTLSEEEVFKIIQRKNPKGESWEGSAGRLTTGEYQGEYDKVTKTGWGYNPIQDNIKEYQNRNYKIKPIGWKPKLMYGEKYNPNELYDYSAVYQKPSNMVFGERITPMKPLSLPIPKITLNERIQPDVIYGDNNVPNTAYTKGIDITHYTDAMGRWAAKINMSTVPGIRGRISKPNSNGDYTIKYNK